MKMTTQKPLTAKDLTEMLRGHYLPENRPPGGIFASEIGSPDGKRYADGLWQSFTRTGGMTLEGHEIKISKTDIAVELSDPSKAEAWMQYCDKWWLIVSDPALLNGFTVPETWGVMAPPSGRRKKSMTIVKEAPLLKPASKEPGLVRLMAWQAKQFRDESYELNRDNTTLAYQNQNLKNELMAARHGTSLGSYEMGIVVKIYDEVKVQTAAKNAKDNWLRGNDVKDIVDAIMDLREIRQRAQTMKNTALSLLNHVEAIDKSLEEARKAGIELAKNPGTQGPRFID